MKKILLLVYLAFAVLIIVNYVYYKNLYNKQVNYIVELLDRQVQLVGLSVDSTNNGFVSDLNKINFSDDISTFFTDPSSQAGIKEKMKV